MRQGLRALFRDLCRESRTIDCLSQTSEPDFCDIIFAGCSRFWFLQYGILYRSLTSGRIYSKARTEVSMSFDFMDVGADELDIDAAPFEGLPQFSDPLNFDGATFDVFGPLLDTPTHPATALASSAQPGEQTAVTSPQPIHQTTQSRLLYWDANRGCLTPVSDHLESRSCSPPISANAINFSGLPLQMNNDGELTLQMASAGKQSAEVRISGSIQRTAGFSLTSPLKARQGDLLGPLSGSSIEELSLSPERKSKMAGEDGQLTDGFGGINPDISRTNPLPSPSPLSNPAERVRPNAQYRTTKDDFEGPLVEKEYRRPAIAARKVKKALRQKQKRWKRKEQEAIRQATEYKRRQDAALARAEHYRRRRCRLLE